jgi:hypothetical protein
MSNTLILNQPFVLVGLPTYTFTIPATKAYSVHVELTEVPVSGLSVVVNQNASPIFTAPTITPTQIAQQFKFGFLATLNDTITVVVSSSTANDLLLNTVKVTCTLQEGF